MTRSDEHAGLRRVAALVNSASPETILSAVTEELARITDPETGLTELEVAAVVRYEPDATATIVAWCSDDPNPPPRTSRFPLEGTSVLAEVFRTGRPARVDGYGDSVTTIASVARELGLMSSVGVPVTIDGRVWGCVSVHSRRRRLPDGTEARAEAFAEIAAAAISVADARVEVHRLTEQQAALRRVATQVARDVPEAELFASVAEEVGRLLEADATGVLRYEPGETLTVVASWSPQGARQEVGSRWPLLEGGPATEVWRTGRASTARWSEVQGEQAAHVREQLGIRASVGGPIRVEGRLWGVLTAHSTGPWPLPPDAAARVTEFAELIATAISNAHARTEARRLAEEQAALRRVATLVARQAEPAEIFSTVAAEVARVLHVDDAWLLRYEPGETATIVGGAGKLRGTLAIGLSIAFEGASVVARVYRTGETVRVDDMSKAEGQLAAYVSGLGVRTSIGTPIMVEGRLWGTMITAWHDVQRVEPQIESRVREFTELVATALANVEARAALAASRERVLVATDEARRRFERDLHDGAQQRLVTIGAELEAVAAGAPADKRELLERVGLGIVAVLDELRELSRGLHPAVLSEGGLAPALRALARRSAVAVRLDVELDRRFEERVEVAAYYVVSEALTNAAKHAGATVVDIRVADAGGLLVITIRDDGAGGADPSRGSGLLGLIDRVEALGGRAAIESPPGEGTSIHMQLPA